MNRKLLCRIVSNSYQSFSNVETLNDEIDLLRTYKSSNNLIIDKMMKFHEKIISSKGAIPFEEIVNYLYEISKINLKEHLDYIEILRLYTKEDFHKIIKVLIKSDYLNEYKLLFIESFVNSIYFKQNKFMLVFRQSVVSKLLPDIEIIKQKILEILNETKYYLKKKKQFEISQIKKCISKFYDNYSEILKIDKIYLFGSYAKKKNDEYSDIDLLVFYKGNKIDVSLNNLVIKTVLFSEYEMSVDTVPIVEENGMDSFDKKVMSYAIRLI